MHRIPLAYSFKESNDCEAERLLLKVDNFSLNGAAPTYWILLNVKVHFHIDDFPLSRCREFKSIQATRDTSFANRSLSREDEKKLPAIQ